MLFIDARNYYTVVDRTLNEWSPWQLKNLTAIVWLYRGEKAKYEGLLQEYHKILGEGEFSAARNSIQEKIKALRQEAKEAVEKAAKKERKKTQAAYDEKIAAEEELLTVAEEAIWLETQFGDGVYTDIPGLCKAANLSEIEEKGWSLTPGAYVGVAPIEDDGVDFHQRMQEIHGELAKLQKESNELMETISRNFAEMGL